MKRSTLVAASIAVAALGVGLAVGAGIGHGERGTTSQTAGSEPTAGAEPDLPTPTPAEQAAADAFKRLITESVKKNAELSSWQALWARLTNGPHDEGSGPAFQRLVELARTDRTVFDELVRLFNGNPDPDAKMLLKSLLAQVGGRDVLDLSMRLASSADPTQRLDGFDLLHRQPSATAEVRTLLKRALTKETDPAALSQAVAALQPTATTPEEAKEVVGMLRNLTKHADPMVRRQSIMTLSQWDGSGDLVAPLREALADESAEVRQAAIWATREAGNRSDGVKTELLTVAYNRDESPEIRQSALRALERFPLNREEYASYDKLRSELADTPVAAH